jgi:hypothetical protein
MKAGAATLLAAALAAAAGCGGDGNSFASSPCSPTASEWAAASPPAKLPVAPESERVDRAAPSFSEPTTVTNPLHPTSRLRSAVLLGEAEGESLRVEVTLLLRTKRIQCGKGSVETLQSQYVAFLGGRIHEVALDWYAQDDAGAVWYFGEDVFNFEEGVVADTEGTWMAGRDGPAAMIMPADPKVGDVYRPENIPDLVFEEVTVKATGKTVDGPRGRVKGAIVVGELHMDGKREAKTFAPGYGEFSTGARNDIEAIALAVPTDARTEPVPRELETLLRGARGSFSQPGSAITRQLTAAWNSYRTQGVPPLLEEQTDSALRRLTRDHGDARQAAVDLGHAALDLLLQYRPPTRIDRARFELWTRQVLIDAEARDESALKGDVATLERIFDRFSRTLPTSTGDQISSLLGALGEQSEHGAFAAAAATVGQLRENAAFAGSP